MEKGTCEHVALNMSVTPLGPRLSGYH